MKIIQEQEGTLIDFGNALSGRIKAIFFFEGLMALFSGSFIVIMTITDMSDSIHSFGSLFSYLLMIGMGIVFLIYAKRFILKLFNRETLLITKQFIYITNRSLLTKIVVQYDVHKISELYYGGKQKMLPHPLKVEPYDYLGFETQQQVINTVHDDGNMSFSYEGKTIRFGKDIYSWQADDIEKIMSAVTENHLKFENLSDMLPDDFDTGAKKEE